jgi:hypothetical protein
VNLELRGVVFTDLSPDEAAEALRQLVPDAEIDAEVGDREERAGQEAEALEDLDQIVTLEEIATRRLVPLSRSTLYRVALEGADDSPFYKRGGRWMATVGDLREWVRSAPRGSDGPVDPMPPTRNSAAAILAEIEERSRR